MKPIIELVGLPGAGKSTLAKALSHTNKVESMRHALRRAAGQWFAAEKAGIPFVGALAGNELILRLYLGRTKANMRSYFIENPRTVETIASWLRQESREENLPAMPFLEHIASFYNLVAKSYLLDRYMRQFVKPVLIDEHWVQFLSFTLNSGTEEAWWAWVSGALDLVDLPQKILWLKGAQQVSEDRQIERNRLASMFAGWPDIEARGAELERRFLRLESELEARGVKVVRICATAPVNEVQRVALASL